MFTVCDFYDDQDVHVQGLDLMCSGFIGLEIYGSGLRA